MYCSFKFQSYLKLVIFETTSSLASQMSSFLQPKVNGIFNVLIFIDLDLSYIGQCEQKLSFPVMFLLDMYITSFKLLSSLKL